MAKIFFSLLEGISNFSTFFRKNFSRGIDPPVEKSKYPLYKGGNGEGGGGTLYGGWWYGGMVRNNMDSVDRCDGLSLFRMIINLYCM